MIPINPEAIGDPTQTPVVYLGEEAGRVLGIPTRQPGLFRKFRVERLDGRDQPGGDKADARYFVLDYAHDLYARAALAAYADACERELPTLARDLHIIAAQHLSTDRPDQPEGRPMSETKIKPSDHRPYRMQHEPGDEVTFTDVIAGRITVFRQVGWHGQSGAFYALGEDPSLHEPGSFSPLWIVAHADDMVFNDLDLPEPSGAA